MIDAEIKITSQARIQTTATVALANLCKIGEKLDKIGKPGNFEKVNSFPVSAPASI